MNLPKIYRCNVCGNIVELLHEGKGTLVCCGQNMELLEANTVDAAQEKHVPVIEKTANGFKVKVGSVPHPMEEAHFIEWIAVIVDGKIDRKFLKPGDVSEAEFCVQSDDILALEYCNLHGLWQSNGK